jgi:hypothetical protein
MSEGLEKQEGYKLGNIFKTLYYSEKGITVISLIVGVAIIGTLSATVVTSIYGPSRTVEANPSESELIKSTTTNLEGSQSDLNMILQPMDLIEDQPDLSTTQTAAIEAANQTELKIVQTAIDTMMIERGLTLIKATDYTNDMAVFPRGNPLYPRYLRNQIAQNWYCCDNTGIVTQHR